MSLISQYIEQFDDPIIIKKVFDFSNWSQSLPLGKGICIVTELIVIGSVTDIDDLTNSFIQLNSTRSHIDYSESIEITQQSGGLVEIRSKFESVHQTYLQVEQWTPKIFESIKRAHIKYTHIQENDRKGNL